MSDPITAPIPEFCRLSGLGRTAVYEMMGTGTLQYIKRGKRTLIVVASWQRFIDHQLCEGIPPDHSTYAALAAKDRKRKERQELAAGIELGELGLDAPATADS